MLVFFFHLIFLFLAENLLRRVAAGLWEGGESKVLEKDSGLRIKPCKIILNYKSRRQTFQEAIRFYIHGFCAS